ncbi:MAG: hypothetical protein WBV78_10610, partial [Roseobacter sp.]
MVDKDTAPAPNSRARAKARIIAPVQRELRVAGWLSLVAGAIWPVQAAAIAWAVSGWAAGLPPMERTWIAATVFVVCAILRAGLEHRSGALLYPAADQTIARERAVLIAREARAPTNAGSASIAS